MKILAVGDMHLGRRPSRLPPGLANQARELGPAGAWERTVEAALESGVRAVLLAGDVVDQEDDFFEAYRALASGVARLTQAKIEVIGVAGNHDVKVLPRLAEQIPGFKLLGAGGWEAWPITDASESFTLWGWSFPKPRVLTSPLASWRFERRQGLNLGLLHCDRDATSSSYAPVTGTELTQAGLDGWLLGHIHKPDPLSADAPSGYLGSLTGLGRRESGPRGPWLIRIEQEAIAEITQLPLAPLRWQPLPVSIEGIAEAADARSQLLAALRSLDAGLADADHAPDAVALDLCFTGRSRFGAAALESITEADRENIYTGAQGRRYFIDTQRSETRPEIDLADLAKRPDPPGLLAKRLLWLQAPAGNPDRERLIDEARARLGEEAQKSVWNALPMREPTPEQCAQQLIEAGYRALEQLLAQTAETD